MPDDEARSTLASDPGNFTLSIPKLRLLRPDIAPKSRLLSGAGATWAGGGLELPGIERQLQRGDSRAAVVLRLDPLLIACYTDELDCVAVLHFPPELDLVNGYGLEEGTALLTVNFYDTVSVDDDLIPGPGNIGHWTWFNPMIADFLTADEDALFARKQQIAEEEWNRCYQLGLEYFEAMPGMARDGLDLGRIFNRRVSY